MKKIVMIIVMLCILAALSVGLWAYKAFLYTKPLNQAELAELTPDWSVVTHGNWSPWFTEADGSQTWNPTANFNAWLATVPEEEKAWPVLVDVQYAGYELYDNLEVGQFPEDVEDWQSMVAMCELDESREMMDRLKEAMQRSTMGCRLHVESTEPSEHQARLKYGLEDENWNPSADNNLGLLPVLLPALGKHRLIVNMFRTYSIVELERGDIDEFVELSLILMDSARLVDEFPTLISQLVAIAVEADGNQTIAWALKHYSHLFTDEHLLQLDQLLARHQGRTLLWQGEAIVFHDIIRRMVTDRGALEAGGVRSLQGGGASFDLPSSLPDEELHASSQRTLLVYNDIMKVGHDRSAYPLVIHGPSGSEVLNSRKKELNYIGSLLLDMLTPALEKASGRFRLVQEESIGLRLTIAAHRHGLRHGEPPASNEDIDQDLLPD